MKRLATFTLVFLLGASLAFAQETVPSRIKEVTLFSNQALVKREAKVKAHKGINELFLELQAFRVDTDSLSAKVFGEGEIFSVQFKEVYVKEPPQENIEALKQKIKGLKESKRTLMDEKSVFNRKEEFLNSIIDFSKTQVPQDLKTTFPKTEDLEKTLGFLSENFQRINGKKQALDPKIEEMDKQIQVLEKELASLKQPGQETKKVIEVLFNSKKEQEIKIETSYLAYDAFWQPFYKVNASLNLDKVDLTMFSKIKQKTGEDWKQISLSLSNVIPLKGAGLPSPGTWILDVSRPREVKARSQAFLMEKRALEPNVEEMGFAGDKEEADFAYAQKKELPLSFEYQMPQALDIQSKDKETLLPIFSKSLKGEFSYFAVPRVSPLTFLVCRAKADNEILAGPLNVYFGDRYIGKTFLSEKRAGDEFKMSLGADREVKVKKEKIKDKIKETFFGKIERKTVVREMAFKITLENLKKSPVKINILDSIPVSRTDRIEVKDLEITPEPVEKDYQDKQGVCRWEFDLQPGSTQEINIEFVVTYPKDEPILGL
ncbi:MAG: mucoidy inhibitor MuiA family protein [Pseudomonadota bacterium]